MEGVILGAVTKKGSGCTVIKLKGRAGTKAYIQAVICTEIADMVPNSFF
jgi:hypothetical protein